VSDDDDGVVALSPRTLRGLAHPLRVRLLNLLRERGPSTASRLADQLGQSSGATSYHLRQLATYGFVAEDAARGTARERWWRAVHRGTTLNVETGRTSAEATEGYLRSVATADFQRVESFLSELPTVPEQWHEAISINTGALRLTPEQAVELRTRLIAVLDEYPADHPEQPMTEGSARVSVQWQVFPLLRPAEPD